MSPGKGSAQFQRSTMPEEKEINTGTSHHVEVVRTRSSAPSNANSYEKGGLRTGGNGLDHYRPNKVNTCLRRVS